MSHRVSPGLYAYNDGDIVVDFSNPKKLGGGYAGRGFVQEEQQCFQQIMIAYIASCYELAGAPLVPVHPELAPFTEVAASATRPAAFRLQGVQNIATLETKPGETFPTEASSFHLDRNGKTCVCVLPIAANDRS